MSLATPKVSVIMPSLNVAPYIDECLASVVRQTLEDIEIICVDAGSTDGTLEYLKDAAAKDTRITVLVSDQKSYGHQMNLGLDAAHGDYIGIVETDDWIEPTMFERLWSAASEQNADFVKCNYYWYRTTPEFEDEPFDENVPFENLARCSYDTPFRPLNDRKIFEATPSIWSGIYRRAFLSDCGIRFNETPGASYQDVSFHFMVCSCAQRAYLVNEYLHHYRKDNDASSVNSPGKVFCICDEARYFEAFLEGNPRLKEALYPYYLSLKFEKYRWNFDRLSPKLQGDFLEVFHSEFAAHLAEGMLHEDCFTPVTWRRVNQVASSPVSYYHDFCKKYSLRKMGDDLPEATVVKASEVANPDATIIIPLFNCAQYVQLSVGSALKQSHGNIEVICVDDGSSDDTLQTLVDFVGSDERACILHQENMGLSTSRNHALAIAKGSHVLFLDGDDALREDTVESLLAKARELDTEMIMFDGEAVYESEELAQTYTYYIDGYSYDFVPDEPMDGISYICRANKDGKYRVSACMCFYKLAFLKQQEARFIDGILHEDNPFTFKNLLHAQRVWHTNERYYLRTIHENSIMTSGKSLFHVYGLLMCYFEIWSLSREVPYSDEFDLAASDILKSLINQLCDAFEAVEDEDACWQKHTIVEMTHLRQLLGYRAFGVLEEANQREHDIVNSVSFKAGRILTFPLRMLRDLVRR